MRLLLATILLLTPATALAWDEFGRQVKDMDIPTYQPQPFRPDPIPSYPQGVDYDRIYPTVEPTQEQIFDRRDWDRRHDGFQQGLGERIEPLGR